ncbi:hypothetical protein PT317_02365 [Metamycoplasma hyosynoviae]|uniref:Uncharacterized protein n=1 Tax=Metamycoplasma hyosynoviae TaxID=29559 RepID=A0A4P1QGV9_9BACT|nr:hypothetical protein [Metamycoplasma hyosynoviae]ASI54137.1 hypothetical protein MHSN_03085 [Metamycoplasma hyosynoviae]MDC8937423.1 hypothetical protein [Metamycoplasma hyosynoviae]MDD1360829.1 hypothetical protein [Metamycoplasma hyosynoviae]MDD1362062.1 hypothetical protein [Metamycoplasma hyosynoviae]MDD1372258.1 hypothetical protein [Metamycoplasma hyosynoviae]
MPLKPIINQTSENTIVNNDIINETVNRIAYESLQTRALSTDKKGNKLEDPHGIIPNGIYKVFKLEKNVKLISIILCLIISIASAIAITLFATNADLFVDISITPKIKWGWYIIPVILLGITSYIFIIESIELSGISRSVVAYRESIKLGALSTPPFITLLYRKLIMKQVSRTWLTVAIIFYVGVFTLIFFGLKDVKWKLLDFKKWITNSFPNPMLVVYILCSIMASVLIMHVVFSIFRKKRTVDIQSFFGNEVMNYNELQEQKSKAHKFYAKIFFLSVLLILILPLIIYIILKKTVWKGK